MLQYLRSRAIYDYYSVFVSPMIIKYKKKRSIVEHMIQLILSILT